MNTQSLSAWPSITTEPVMTAYNTKVRNQRPGIVKLLDAPAPPDENTVRKLNELARKQPFCALHRVKKHDPL
jgi:hypothetical protein